MSNIDRFFEFFFRKLLNYFVKLINRQKVHH